MSENIAQIKNLLILSLRGEAEAIHKNDKICHFDRIFFVILGIFFSVILRGRSDRKIQTNQKNINKKLQGFFDE